MTVTFCGHSDVEDLHNVERWLKKAVKKLIEQGADCFYLGGYGKFDALAANIVSEEKTLNPTIKSVLVVPYIDWKTDFSRYDFTLYPPLERVPKRYAILRRNQWMVDNADAIVSYIIHEWGGAAKTQAYAMRKKKYMIEYRDYIG